MGEECEQCRWVKTGEQEVKGERMNRVWVKLVNSLIWLKLVNRRYRVRG